MATEIIQKTGLIETGLKKLLYHKYHLFPDMIPVRAYVKLTGVKLLAPFYHTVSDHPLPHLNCFYRVRTSGEFEADLDMLLKNFQPVDLQAVIKSIKEKAHFNKPVFFLSFDDGLREFHDVIAPVLLRKGIPATCFLNSAFIDNKELFYRYKVCLLVNELRKKSNGQMPQVNKWMEDKKVRPSSYSHFLMKINYHQRHLADELAQVIGFSFENYLRDHRPYLTSEQITGLINKGFTFGSHSIDHPGFGVLSLEEQVRQTIESTSEITGRFNLPYTVFSFPFTDSGICVDFFDKINSSVHFDATFGSAGMKKDSYYNHMQRIPVEYYDLSIKKRIKRDYFYYIFRLLLNKNRIKRSR
jgi:peptidoglycan/xylan/chitin deacetylase (PgdA/CDA1 family)